MVDRPVYLRGFGQCSARGGDLTSIREVLLRGDASISGSMTISGRQWPYQFFAQNRRNERLTPTVATQSVGQQMRASAGIDASRWTTLPLFVGSSSFDIGVLETRWATGDQTLPATADSAGQLAAWLGLAGEPWCFSTACTSALTALDAAASLIAAGEINEAVVLGVEFANRTTLAGFASLSLVSSGGCQPFGRLRDGLMLGEAIAGVVLSAKKTAGCWRLAGLSSRLDAGAITGASTDDAVFVRVMREALQQADLAPGQIELIKLQAAGSPNADLAEAIAIKRIFGESIPPLVSLKPYFGHTLGASGAVELSALIACLDEGMVPGTPCAEDIDPDIGLPLLPHAEHRKVCHVLFNLSGFGGKTSLVISKESA